MRILAPYNHCFGDCWALLNYAMRESYLKHKPITVSRYVCAGSHLVPGVPPGGEDVHKLLFSQAVEIDGPLGIDVRITKQVTTTPSRITVDVFHHPYYPTRRVWDPGPHGKICVQTDNALIPEHCARAFKLPERKALYDWLKDKEHVVLGKTMSVHECVEAAATSDVFIGMDSGMSHLCHSVGVPMILLDWEGLDKHHPKKTFYRFNRVSQAIKLAKSLMKDPEPWLDMVKLAREENERCQ